uniref:Sphingosine-1-phosphate lyase n=1 Tax=Panagrolaimus sp. PS1159 TaxID=55785 RepID=A0AC35FZQ8_9BILA
MPFDKATAIAHTQYFIDEINDRLSRFSPIVLVGGTAISLYAYFKIRTILRRSDRPIHQRLMGYFVSLARYIPSVENKIQKQFEGIRGEIIESIHKYDQDRIFIRELLNTQLSPEDIIQKASEYESMGTFDVNGGRVSGTVYTDRDQKHIDFLSEIFKKYAYSNPLHPDVFPGVRKMEAEIVRMAANLFHGPPEACGTVSSGGTESIMLACFAYRNRAYAKGITEPVMVIPVTAHAAFDKAAFMMNIRVKHIPVDSNNRVNLKAMRSAISSDTCMIVGSAPNFPTGTIDDIVQIANLGLRYKVPVHVDACLGGFLIPFMEEAGFPLSLFDFRLPGVTSISCDTHKYGYAPKGTSVILYRSPEYLHDQYFAVTDWTGGIYATPTLAGSRSGLAIALTWGTMMYFGRNVYVSRTRAIIDSARELAKQIATIPGLEIYGTPEVSVVAFRSKEFNIYAVADKMNHAGWNLNTLQHPDSIHFCMTFNQAKSEVISAFIADLRKACEEVNEMPNKGGASKTAAIYGTAALIPDRSLVSSMTHVFLDACYSMPEKLNP